MLAHSTDFYLVGGLVPPVPVPIECLVAGPSETSNQAYAPLV